MPEKSKFKQNILTCFEHKQVCRIHFRYDACAMYYIPLVIGDKLFLGAEEDDFLINGYTIRRFKDVKRAQIKDDIYGKILMDEGIIDRVVTPDVDLSSWEAVLRSLQRRDRNIIVEKESLDKRKREFVIGRIEKVESKSAYVRQFDADGIWESEPHEIPYKELTSVSFASRYVDIFSKYLGDLPDNFGKK